MDGTLDNHDLLDVIATLTSRHESGRLQITVSGSRGAFFFKKGKLVDARMGPFSGFPAVNLAVSLGEATLQFDSSIQPPASTSTVIATNERVLLKERFGIETIDLDSVEEDQTTQTADAKLPVAITPQTLLTEAPLSPETNAPHESAYNQPAEDNIASSAGAGESRRRTARSRRAGRTKRERRTAEQFRNQAAEDARTKVEKEKSFEMANRVVEEDKPGKMTSPALTPEPTTSEKSSNPEITSIAEEEKPGETFGPSITLESSTVETREDAKPGELTSPALTLEFTTSEKPKPGIKSIAEEEKPGETSGPSIALESSPIETREDAKPDEITSPALTPEFTTSEKFRNSGITSIAEEERPVQTYAPAMTLGYSTIETRKESEIKRCPECNRVYSDSRAYCRYDSTKLVSEIETSFTAAVKPEAATGPALFWTLITITLLVSGVLGYFLNSYISRERGAATPIRAEAEHPPNAEQDQPVVEGPLHGKETTLVKPEYPATARSEGVTGKVKVSVLVNKQGLVVSARALNGHPLLRASAEAAARKSKFSPEKLAGQRSKISGTITYNFKL